MHIPDGFLSAPVAIACGGLSAGAVAAACARGRVSRGPGGLALVGVTAAFVFAAQMVNFPVAGGTSGHLVGGVLAAVLLGPADAVVVMTAVLVLQCLVFGDGGLLALGANVLDMGVVHPLVGFALYRLVAGRGGPKGARGITAAAFGAWVATAAAAATCAGELALSGVAAPGLLLGSMLAVHAVVGLGEAVITALVLAAVSRARPELLSLRAATPPATSVLVPGLVASLGLALFVSPFACAWPDGLERVVERVGLEPSRAHLAAPSLLHGYSIPGLGGGAASTSLAAALGTLAVFAACLGIGYGLAPRRAPGEPGAPAGRT
ncbi:MAG TPA: energy-coupling factor ABC transporter permease [Polyangiaceae bacterium]